MVSGQELKMRLPSHDRGPSRVADEMTGCHRDRAGVTDRELFGRWEVEAADGRAQVSSGGIQLQHVCT